jgi:hypothetical protein
MRPVQMRKEFDPYPLSFQAFITLGKEKFVDLGLGTHRMKCHVHAEFRYTTLVTRGDLRACIYPGRMIPILTLLHHLAV